MNDYDIVKAAANPATEAIRQTGGGIFAHFLESGRSRRRREELQDDVNAIQQLRDNGIDVTYYRGLAMEAETERQVNNLNNTLSKADSLIDWDNADLNNVDPEFQFRWFNEVRNVSDETLQDLWARIFAGRMDSPESITPATMSVVRDLTAGVAREFQGLCSLALRDMSGAPLLVPDFCYGPILWTSMKPAEGSLERLSQSRLVLEGTKRAYSQGLLSGAHGDGLLFVHKGCTWFTSQRIASMRGITFTFAAQELGRVVPVQPDLSEYLLEKMYELQEKLENKQKWYIVAPNGLLDDFGCKLEWQSQEPKWLRILNLEDTLAS